MFTVPNVIDKRTISVEPFAFHNGFRYQVPTDVLGTRRRSTDTSPLACPRWQFRASASDRAVADVPGAIAAAKHTNAQAKARELIIIFVNFVFIVIVSFCLSFLCFGRLWLLVIELSFRAI